MSAADKIAKIGSGTKNAAIGLGVLAAGAAVAWLGWKTYKGARAIAAVGKDVVTRDLNPASDQNLVYRGVNAAIGGGEDYTLGTKIYDSVQWIKGIFGGGATVTPPDPTQKLINDTSADTGAELRGL